MKIAVVYNTKECSKACDTAELIKESIDEDIFLFDMSNEKEPHENYYYLKSQNPDVIVTLDMAGFEMETTGEIIAYNTFLCKMAHVILNEDDIDAKKYQKRQNLSMFTYLPADKADEFGSRYSEYIPNVMKYAMGAFESGQSIREWFDDFKAECMIR